MRCRALLVDGRDEVLERFVARVRRFHEASAGPALIVDDLPLFFDHLLHRLDSQPPPEDAEAASLPSSTAHGREHGEQCFNLGIDIVTMDREWAVLRDVILEFLGETEPLLPVAELRLVLRAISHASCASLARYVELADAERYRLKAEHVALVVHDLRNQVQGAAVAFELLQRDVQRLDALECLGASLFGLRRVLDRELSRARLEALKGHLPTACEALPVRDLIEQVVRDVRPLAITRSVSVHAHVDPLTVHGDARLLHSALVNLVGNAVKFTAPGSEVTVTAKGLGSFAAFDVADRCGGLAPQVRDRLFSAHAHGAGDGSGFGLGLAIARQAAELHNGTLDVEDVPTVGCRFRLLLPTMPALCGPQRVDATATTTA